MTEHTPGSWVAKPGGGNAWVVMKGGMVLATLNRQDRPKWNKANAEFICRACNSHDKLTEENEKLLKACKYVRDGMCKPAVLCDGDWQTGLFCGLEDHSITDCYEACMYGYNKALERVTEWATGDYLEEAIALAEKGKDKRDMSVKR